VQFCTQTTDCDWLCYGGVKRLKGCKLRPTRWVYLDSRGLQHEFQFLRYDVKFIRRILLPARLEQLQGEASEPCHVFRFLVVLRSPHGVVVCDIRAPLTLFCDLLVTGNTLPKNGQSAQVVSNIGLLLATRDKRGEDLSRSRSVPTHTRQFGKYLVT
jgi:hypothetical protein